MYRHPQCPPGRPQVWVPPDHKPISQAVTCQSPNSLRELRSLCDSFPQSLQPCSLEDCWQWVPGTGETSTPPPGWSCFPLRELSLLPAADKNRVWSDCSQITLYFEFPFESNSTFAMGSSGIPTFANSDTSQAIILFRTSDFTTRQQGEKCSGQSTRNDPKP